MVYFFAIISILIGTYKEFIIISTLIIIHELGHFLTATLLNVETKYIYIYPLGGISKFNMDISTNPIKELLILIMGPLFQIIGYYLLINIFEKELVKQLHIGILIFNLLPIYPLDGGKILNILLNKIFPYKKSYKIIILISYIMTIIILLNNNKVTINMIITYIFLTILIRKEENKLPILYQKLLIERLNNKYNYKKIRIIKDINNLYKYNKNIIKKNNKYYSEQEYIKKIYKFW